MYSSEDLTGTVVLKRDNAFFVATPDGGVPPGSEHPLGLHRDDCRFLSAHELRVGGAAPRLLAASGVTGAQAVHELTNPALELPDGRSLALQTLRIRLERTLVDDATMHERLHVHMYGGHAAHVDVEIALAADFRPMLVLSGMVDVPPAEVAVEPVDGGVRFAARGLDGVLRATTVTADPEPVAVAGGVLRFRLALEPDRARDVLLAYALHQAPEPPPAPAPRRGRRDAAPGATSGDGSADVHVHGDDELFDRVLGRALADLRMLRSTIDGQAYYAAGIPWYATLFGRDSLITALEALAFDPLVAEQTLRALAARLGRVEDPVHEEEPGKVLHELRGGELAATGLTPFTRYYATVDATPLFLCLLGEQPSWSGDLELFRELQPEVDAALRWIDCYGDHDGDGLLDYHAAAPDGLRNQGWKDSADGIVDARGVPLEPPVAVVEAQGYAVRAKRAIAALFERDGDGARAETLADEAAEMQARLDRFWLADRRCYSMALDLDGEPSRALASNQGHLLWAGAVPGDRAADVRDALMGEALFSGWGIRTLGAGEAGFNPVSYHRGTVWPHDTAICAAGLRRYGHADDFMRVFEALLDAASHAGDLRLPELFAGFPRTPSELPVPYPVSCRPQAWAAGALPWLLTGALGLDADGLERRLVVRRPRLPRSLSRLEVEGVRIAGARVDLRFERTGDGDHVAVTDARVDGDVEVVLEAGGAR